jgi:hypothetical protein
MNNLKKYNWLFPVLILIALSLGVIGFYQYFELQEQSLSLFTAIYFSLQLFVLEFGAITGKIPVLLEIARFLAPAVTASGIFLAIWEPFYKNYQLHRIHLWKNHLVVCGLSKKAELLIEDFIKQENGKVRIVVIDADESRGSLLHLRKKGVIFLNGNATNEETLLKTNILHARFLLALTQDEKINIQIAQLATRLYHQYPKRILPDTVLQVILHVDDFYTLNIFKEFHEKAELEESDLRPSGSKMDYHVFSIFQLAASYMVDRYSPDQYRSLQELEDPPAHILILGDTLAAEYLILEAAHMYHFANLKKTRITVVSDDIAHILQKMDALYPFLRKTVDITYISIVEFFSDNCPVDCNEIAVAFIALHDDGKSIYFSRKLRQLFYSRNQLKKNQNGSIEKGLPDFTFPPIKTLLPRNTALVHIFSDTKVEMKMLNIEMVNMDHQLCNKKTIVDDRKAEDFIAQHIHYEWVKNHAFRDHTGMGSMETEWDELKDAQKDSNRLPARHLNIKLRFVNAEFTDQQGGKELNMGMLDEQVWNRIARMEHYRWMAEKYLNGFVYTRDIPDKEVMHFLNLALKCHPDMVPFEDLTREIQEKDMFTFRMAPEIARLNNKRIIQKS